MKFIQACFKCFTCKSSLRPGQHFVHDTKIYCKPHYAAAQGGHSPKQGIINLNYCNVFFFWMEQNSRIWSFNFKKLREKPLKRQPLANLSLFIHPPAQIVMSLKQVLLCTPSWNPNTPNSKLIRKKILPTLKRKCSVHYHTRAPHHLSSPWT